MMLFGASGLVFGAFGSAGASDSIRPAFELLLLAELLSVVASLRCVWHACCGSGLVLGGCGSASASDLTRPECELQQQ